MRVCDFLMYCWALVSYDPKSCQKMPGDVVYCNDVVLSEHKTERECLDDKKKRSTKGLNLRCAIISRD